MLTGSSIINAVHDNLIAIDPFDPDRIGPNSYDLTLNENYKIYSYGESNILDMKVDNPTHSFIIPENGVIFCPGQLYLCCTNEVAGSHYFVPFIDGRSSIGRLGVCTHVTAGRGDLGFIGQWTLEITVVRPIRIYPNVRICQIYFDEPVGEIRSRYQGKYNGSVGVVQSQLYKDFEK